MGQINIGVDNVARKVKSAYVGVDGVARKIKQVFVGDSNGIARLVWQAIKKLTAYKETKYGLGTLPVTALSSIQGVLKLSDNHIVVGTYESVSSSDVRENYLYNVYLNDDSSVSSYTKFNFNREHTSLWQATLRGLVKLNDTYGVAFAANYYTASSDTGSDYYNLYLFKLDNGAYYNSLQIMQGTSDGITALLPMDNDSVLIITYYSTYAYYRFYQYNSGNLEQKAYNALENLEYIYGAMSAAKVSGNRFILAYSNETNTIINLYSYNSDNTVTKLNSVTINEHFGSIHNIIDMGNDVYVLISFGKYIAFRLDSNNFVCGNVCSYDFAYYKASRIGNTNNIAILNASYQPNMLILYVDTSNLTTSVMQECTPIDRGTTIIPYKDDQLLALDEWGSYIDICNYTFE